MKCFKCIKEHGLENGIKTVTHILSLKLQKWKDQVLMRIECWRLSAGPVAPDGSAGECG